MVRVTRPGGRIVLGELNRWSPWAGWRRVKGAGAVDVTAHGAAHLPPVTPRWLIARAERLERWARPLGSICAAFAVARGHAPEVATGNATH